MKLGANVPEVLFFAESDLSRFPPRENDGDTWEMDELRTWPFAGSGVVDGRMMADFGLVCEG